MKLRYVLEVSRSNVCLAAIFTQSVWSSVDEVRGETKNAGSQVNRLCPLPFHMSCLWRRRFLSPPSTGVLVLHDNYVDVISIIYFNLLNW